MGLLVAALLLPLGCASAPVPESTKSGEIFEVEIGESVMPKIITVKAQDEVRWVNRRSSAVRISLAKPSGPNISCLKGFAQEGSKFSGSQMPDSIFGATVESNKFASLCFSESGIYEYTVRMGRLTSGEEITLPGTVMVK
jgi:plastocyanin